MFLPHKKKTRLLISYFDGRKTTAMEDSCSFHIKCHETTEWLWKLVEAWEWTYSHASKTTAVQQLIMMELEPTSMEVKTNPYKYFHGSRVRRYLEAGGRNGSRCTLVEANGGKFSWWKPQLVEVGLEPSTSATSGSTCFLGSVFLLQWRNSTSMKGFALRWKKHLSFHGSSDLVPWK